MNTISNKNNLLDDIDNIKRQLESLNDNEEFQRIVPHWQLDEGKKYYIVQKEKGSYELLNGSYELKLSASAPDLCIHYIFNRLDGKSSIPLAFDIRHGDALKYFFFTDRTQAINYCLNKNMEEAIRVLNVCVKSKTLS
jgi:hypothetical protein